VHVFQVKEVATRITQSPVVKRCMQWTINNDGAGKVHQGNNWMPVCAVCKFVCKQR